MSTAFISKEAAKAAVETIGAGGVDKTKLSDADFQRVSALALKLAGIVIKEHKREMVYSRLTRRLRALNFPTISAYLDYVESPAGADEVGELINAITTNLTSFFRENHHFEHLRDEMMAPMAAEGRRRVRLWSSACSTGEEPYSIVMTLLSTPGFERLPDAKLLATDLDTNVLGRAASGVYASDRQKGLSDAQIKRFFQVKPNGDLEARAEVKKWISFNQLNLLGDWPMRGPFDVIFCRNVLIYFDATTKRAIVDRLTRLIRPGGALYLGHSESLLGDHPLLRSEGRTIYRRLE